MPRVTLRGINFAAGASIEELDDFLAFLRAGIACAKLGVRGYGGNLRDRRKEAAKVYADLRRAREANRHARMPGIYARSGIPCRRVD